LDEDEAGIPRQFEIQNGKLKAGDSGEPATWGGPAQYCRKQPGTNPAIAQSGLSGVLPAVSPADAAGGYMRYRCFR